MTSAPAPLRASWPDRLGIAASVLCVAHCLATPVLLSLSVVFAHFMPSEERTHRTLAIAIALLGTIALVRGYRQHARPLVLWLMLAGLGCIFFAAYFGDGLSNHLGALLGHWAEVAITFCGSLLMIAAHRCNHTFCRSCACTIAPCSMPL